MGKTEKITVPVVEETTTINGWSKSKISCINEKGCKGQVELNVLFEDGYAVAVREDELICPICGITIGLDHRLRLQ